MDPVFVVNDCRKMVVYLPIYLVGKWVGYFNRKTLVLDRWICRIFGFGVLEGFCWEI